jgi:Holliday junction resolvasome RuvABC ATP-dependent DNA helicase subunit
MKNKLDRKVATDVEGEFLRDISLYSIIGNRQTVRRLRILVDSYLNDKAEGRYPRINHVLFCGKKGSGRTVLAHAYAHSLGCSYVFEAEATTLSMGIENASTFLQKGDKFSAYLIHNVERISFYCSSIIIPAIKEDTLIITDNFHRRETSREQFDRLILFTCEDSAKVNPEIVKNVAMSCYVGNYDCDDIRHIIEQRISYLAFDFIEKDKVVDVIVQLARGDVSLAIHILDWSFRCCRAVGCDSVTVKHLNRALHLLQ